ncbi:hypothetical protein ERJ75_001752600 [Trypanosoma vivax]|uniref:Uncharacterized protein n=1 Tax=Trypanosoma vivax (strain Y486) TaxID=1055687 RepID=G0U2G2_TRYVY|nr:hypothetical protein TRVL_03378 [Trypanosoma vivax]KAH8604318.1 hypothetical protein ERJ75_001752600 [Trypanosoma vivax]CCC50465.1 conserved hypothetical protein [Trypanosoma vivax Y486]
MRQGRVRTESTVQRFSRTAIGEGFDLWDRDYLLGAMRLFLFKGETAPPFQVGPCMDATAEILMQMEEYEDASEQFTGAAEKYKVMQQPELSKLMSIKALECTSGATAALNEVTAYLEEQKDNASAGIARAYAYQASLLLKTSDEGADDAVQKAIEAAQIACKKGWDRVHSSYVVLGDALRAAGRLEDACKAYAEAVEKNSNCITALVRHTELLKLFIAASSDPSHVAKLRSELLGLLESAIALHPRSTLLREKAFLLSEIEGDAVALSFLDPLILNPPPEEADAVAGVGGETVATLLKAKAAILADGGKMAEALSAAEAALQECPGDEEAQAIVAELREAA